MIEAVVNMKIIVVSDSHGKNDVLVSILKQYPHADAFIHCGDIEVDPSVFPQFITVKGNNDIFYDYPDYQILEIAGHRIYITHSHQFSFMKRKAKMAAKAKEYDCDILCYGHTHVAYDGECDGVRMINPGSIWHSRDGREPSYAIIDIEQAHIGVDFIFLSQKKDWFL